MTDTQVVVSKWLNVREKEKYTFTDVRMLNIHKFEKKPDHSCGYPANAHVRQDEHVLEYVKKSIFQRITNAF